MATKDLKNNITIATGINATLSGVTPAKGNIVNLDGYESATFALARGTVTDAGTASGIVFEVQESDSTADTGFTAVANADLLGLETSLSILVDSSDDQPVATIGYVGSKKYVRVVATGSTGTDAAVYGVWVLGHANLKPAGGVNANIAAT